MPCAASCFPSRSRPLGPFAATTAEVVEQLRDVDGLRSGYTGLAEFNAAYNPWQDGKAAQRVVDRLRGML